MPLTLDTLGNHLGQEIGVSPWRTVEQSTIDAFADVTGDHQWIHVDPERAAHGPYRGTIAHGLLTLSLLPALRAEAGVHPEGVGRAVNYGYDRVRFLAPVRAGARLRVRVVLTAVAHKGANVLATTQNTVEVEGDGTPALVAEALTLFVPQA
ncbi:MaoC family dehydratase [Rubrivirga sp. IMCC43871]|uniref:MaoC family dehydratase n=1 Tax=Rubrivirga sp. IMCC43871 TaxID=3391575 RepID=UPI00398FE02D